MRTHDQKTFYTEQEFSKAEFSAIEKAREQAILNKYGNFFLLGTGSYKMSHVYKTTSKSGSGLEEAVALKIISGITQECGSSNLEIFKNQLKSKLRSNEFENSAESEIKLQYDGINRCPNVIPLDGTDLLDWICPDFKRVGVDYVLKMPLADCLFNAIEKIKSAENRIDKIIQLGIDICKALESLHAQGIYHRDIKPANIYLYNGNYCLGDFGISIHKNNLKLYEIGTEEYCAPEQHYRARATNPWLCKKYNHRIDIYSLGLVLYELAGEKPVNQLFTQRMKGALPDLSTESEGLNKIIHTACQFDPDDRYQNATIFKENLERLQQDKNYIPSQDIHITISNQTIAENNLQQPDGNTYIGKEKDPYEDELDPIEDEEKVSDSIANSMWNVGLFWYEKSREEASRFVNLKIDERIMPLTSMEQKPSYNFPIKLHPQDNSKKVRLSQLVANINNIRNMYLIGEGGSGKTTALYSIMENTYKGYMYPIKYADNITIPLFIELSKAPDICGKSYENGHSTFIHRYLYLLIKSAQQKKDLLTEDKTSLREVLGTGKDHEQDDIINTVNHLLNENNGIRFLLLLDGLNEVSRKTILFSEGSATVVEMIIDEIREIQEYKNVTIIITSRADEAVSFENDFSKYYLSGIDETTIKKYLEDNKVSPRNLEQNPRLLITLQNPFFLKLYCRLIFKSGISTPGEILYNFFKENTSMYSLRNRINVINSERSATGNIHDCNRITEKMQWFILDFIIPEIGWYMVKNSLYSIEQETIKIIMDQILTGREDTDICGKCGIAIFEDYHKGNDGSLNTKTYATYLTELNSEHQTYMQVILEYCVYSLGILCVNNQNYEFIHQHFRDFFAAMKVITDMRLALNNKNKTTSIKCLQEFNNNILSLSVSFFMSDLSTTLNSMHKFDFYCAVLDIYRNILDGTVCNGVKNILDIIYRTKDSLSDLNFSYLDLTNCHLYGIEMRNSVFTGSKQTINTMFLKNSNSNISSAVFSPNGKHIFMLVEDSIFRVLSTQSLSEEYVLSNRNFFNPIKDMQYIYGEYSLSGKLLFTVSHIRENGYTNFLVNVYNANTMKCLKAKKSNRFDSIKSCIDYRNFIKISPDDKYLIISDQNNVLTFYPIDQNRFAFARKADLKKFFNHISFAQSGFSDIYMSPRIAIDPLGRYIAVAIAYDPDIVFLDSHSLKEKFRITLPVLSQELNYYEHVEDLKFSYEGKYMALSISFIKKIFILDIEQRIIIGSVSKYNGTIQNFRFIKYKSEVCLLLVLNKGILYSKFTNIIIWSFVQDKELSNLEYADYINVYDCFDDMVLYKDSNGVQISCKSDFSDGTILNQNQDTSEEIMGQFFSADKKYLIIYSEICVQIWTLPTMSNMYEIQFHESICKILYASDKLYVLCTNNIFQVYDLITQQLIIHNNEIFDYTKTHFYDFYISPKGNYLFIRVEVDKYEVYDAQTLKYLQAFKGDFISFNPSETSLIVGYNYTEYTRADVQRIRLQEWKRSQKNAAIFECTSNLPEEIIIRASEKLEPPIKDIYSISGLPYFVITNTVYVPNSDKLLIRIYCIGAERRALLLLNLETNELEKIIEPEFENCDYNNGINMYTLNTILTNVNNNCIPTINLYDLEQFELDHVELTNNINAIKEVEYNLLFAIHDIVIVMNVKTRKYIVIPFLPNLHVEEAVFKNIQLPKYKDVETIFNILEMYGAKIN